MNFTQHKNFKTFIEAQKKTSFKLNNQKCRTSVKTFETTAN